LQEEKKKVIVITSTLGGDWKKNWIKRHHHRSFTRTGVDERGKIGVPICNKGRKQEIDLENKSNLPKKSEFGFLRLH